MAKIREKEGMYSSTSGKKLSVPDIISISLKSIIEYINNMGGTVINQYINQISSDYFRVLFIVDEDFYDDMDHVLLVHDFVGEINFPRKKGKRYIDFYMTELLEYIKENINT